MVGWIGGCCCGDGGGGGDPLSCSTTHATSFTDDFSPSYDPGWNMFLPNLTTVGGVCQCTGQSYFGFPYTYGYALKLFRKLTLQGTVEASAKLVSWPTAPLPNNVLGAYESALIAVFNNYGKVRVLAYRNYWHNVYAIGVGGIDGNLFYLTTTTPQAGDTFGYRLSNFLSQAPFGVEVVCQTLEVIVNGAVIWTNPTPPLWTYPLFNPCEFWSGLEISQAFFPQFPMFPGQTILKLDDYAITCL